MPEEEEEGMGREDNLQLGYTQGVQNHDFDSNLGPYPMDRYALWKDTTGYITEAIINKLEVSPRPAHPL